MRTPGSIASSLGRGLKGDGSDYWRLDAATGQPQPGSDGIPEMRVLISSTGNGQLLAIGVESPAETASQVVTGLTYQQLAARGGQLLLNDGLNLDPPRNLALLPCLPPTATDLAALRQALIQVAGQRPGLDGIFTRSNGSLGSAGRRARLRGGACHGGVTGARVAGGSRSSAVGDNPADHVPDGDSGHPGSR